MMTSSTSLFNVTLLNESHPPASNMTWYMCIRLDPEQPLPGVVKSDIYRTCSIIELSDKICYWLFMILGLPANIAAFVTAMTTPRTPTTLYVALLSVGDFVALTVKSIPYALADVGLYGHAIFGRNIWFMNFFHYSDVYPNWILVFICFERMVCVRCPFQRNANRALKRAKWSGAVLAVCVVTLYIITSLFMQIASTTWVLVYTLCQSLIPLVLISFCTVAILDQLKKNRRRRSKVMSQRANSKRAKAENSITVMLIVAAISFFILTTPMCFLAFTILHHGLIWETPYATLKFRISEVIIINLKCLTHVINFYLYCVSSRVFREQLCSLFRPTFGRRYSKTPRTESSGDHGGETHDLDVQGTMQDIL